MSAGERVTSAFRRIGAVSSIRLVRRDDTIREDRHGSISDLTKAAHEFAKEIEAVAARWEQTI